MSQFLAIENSGLVIYEESLEELGLELGLSLYLVRCIDWGIRDVCNSMLKGFINECCVHISPFL